MPVRLGQSANAPSSMFVTELGMVTEVMLALSRNALSAMLVTSSGMVTTVSVPVYAVSTPLSTVKSSGLEAIAGIADDTASTAAQSSTLKIRFNFNLGFLL